MFRDFVHSTIQDLVPSKNKTNRNNQPWFTPKIKRLVRKNTQIIRLRVVIPTGRYSDRSIFRQVVIPTGRYSDRSIFRQFYIPTGPTSRYFDRSLFRQTDRYNYDRSLVRQVVIPTGR